jgi:GT2 family glycosyltransferase
MDLSIVIPAHNRKNITIECLRRLHQEIGGAPNITIIVVDDGSTDGTDSEVIKQFPNVVILKGNGDLWWTGATNMGVQYSLENDSKYILTLNDDINFKKGFISELLKVAENYPDNIICPLVCYENNKELVLSAGRFHTGFLGYKVALALNKVLLTDLHTDIMKSELENGYAMLIPQKVFQNIGLFDYKNYPHHMGDMDFVLRARNAGYSVLVSTKSVLYATFGKNYLPYTFVNQSALDFIKSLYDIRSPIYLRTRISFIFQHTKPVTFAPLSFIYFVSRITCLILIKMSVPMGIRKHLARAVYGKAFYD